jgi:hypothetical protein
LSLIFLISSSCLCAQEITTQEFSKIDKELKNLIYRIDTSTDFELLKSKFSLDDSASEKLDQLINNKTIRFSKDQSANSWVLYFFTESDVENAIHLFLYAMDTKLIRTNEKFMRAEYHLVLSTTVSVKNDKVTYENTDLYTNPEFFKAFFLRIHNAGYVNKTKPIHDKYGFVPPPPLPPPHDLN